LQKHLNAIGQELEMDNIEQQSLRYVAGHQHSMCATVLLINALFFCLHPVITRASQGYALFLCALC